MFKEYTVCFNIFLTIRYIYDLYSKSKFINFFFLKCDKIKYKNKFFFNANIFLIRNFINFCHNLKKKREKQKSLMNFNEVIFFNTLK